MLFVLCILAFGAFAMGLIAGGALRGNDHCCKDDGDTPLYPPADWLTEVRHG